MGALLYLTLHSTKNRISARLRRLKEPRYLIGAVVGVAYFWMVLFRPRPSSRTRGAAGASAGILSMLARGRTMIEIFGSVALLVIAALAWLWPGTGRPALRFTQAEVQFLFPAPFTRRQLIRYKVLRGQLGAIFGSALMTLFFRPSSAEAGWMFFAGVAITMAIINLHLTGISLNRESLRTHGAAGRKRQWLPLALVCGALAVLVAAVAMDWQQLTALTDGPSLLDEIERLASTGPVAEVLWPFRAVVRLPLSATPTDFFRSLPWALLILGLNFAWVLRSDASFEEASAEHADKTATDRTRQPATPRAKGATATPFALALTGPPEMAIFWKNLILVGRYASLKTLARFLPLFLIFGVAATRGGQGGLAGLFGGACLLVFIGAVLLGPQVARNDLRQDLANLAILKTWPIRGGTLVRGQVMAPAALLIVAAWCGAIGAFLFATRIDIDATVFVAAVVLAPGLILMQLLFQNGIAVMWPSWVIVSSNRARGVDVMGQRMIMMVGLMLALVISVLPAAIAGGLIMGGAYWMTGAIWIIAPAIVAALVLLAQAFMASELIGTLFDRTDVNAVDATEA